MLGLKSCHAQKVLWLIVRPMLGEVFAGHFGRPKCAKVPGKPCGEKAFSGAFGPGNHNAQGFAKGNYYLVLVHCKRL